MPPLPDRPAKGIRRTRSGWQAYLRLDGEFISKHFKPDTPLATMKGWRVEQHARKILRLPAEPDRGSLAEDCAVYLKAVQGMKTYRDRAYRIGQWQLALGGSTVRDAITAVDIRRVLEQWRMRKPKALSAGSLNLRRTALMHLYTVLDGKSARNPVKDVPPYRDTPPPLLLPTLKDAQRAIAKVRSDRKENVSRARLQVLLWTGWPPAILMALRPEDVKWQESAALVHGRQKGSGTRPKWTPLLPQAIAALRALAQVNGWGRFNTHSLRKSLHRGCRKAKVRPFRVYDLRHLFLTTLALATKDDRVVAELALHADIRQTRRYTEQSVNPRLRTALATFATLHAPSPSKAVSRVLSLRKGKRGKARKTA